MQSGFQNAQVFTHFILDIHFILLLFYVFKKSRIIPPPFASIDYILVKKQERILEMYHQGKCLKSYGSYLSFCPTRPKEWEGDGKRPEGMYTICCKNPNKNHLSLKIDYPHDHHRVLAREKGLSAGSDIMIHGQLNLWGFYTPDIKHDWTHGCIAVKNDEIEEIYGATSVESPIEIRP